MASRPDPKRVLTYAIVALAAVSILWGLVAWGTGGDSDWRNSMMGGAWVWMPLMMLVPVLLVVLLVYALAPGAHAQDGDALAILERRYARGEIPREEYLRAREDLAGGRRP